MIGWFGRRGRRPPDRGRAHTAAPAHTRVPLVPGLVLLGALAASVILSERARHAEEIRAAELVEQQCADTIHDMTVRLAAIEAIGQAVRGLIGGARGAIRPDDWHRFVGAIVQDPRYRAIEAIFHIVPTRSPTATATGRISLFAPAARWPGSVGTGAVGYNAFALAPWRTGAEAARDSGLATLTASPLPLGPAAPGAGVADPVLLVLLPVFGGSEDPGTVVGRRRDLTGWVALAFQPEALIGEAMARAGAALGLTVRDVTGAGAAHFGGTVGAGPLLYRRAVTIPVADRDEVQFACSDRLDVGQRRWAVRFVSTPDVLARARTGQPMLVLLIGLVLGLALWIAVYALQTSQQRFRELAETASDWFWETDPEGRLTYVSDRFFALTGLAPSEVLGRPLPAAVTGGPSIAGAPGPEPDGAGVDGSFRGREIALTHPTGLTRYFQLSGAPSTYENGVFRGYRGTGTDITERRRAETIAAERASQLQVAIEVMPNGIIMVSDDMSIRVFNNKFLEFWDLTADQVRACARLPDLVRFLAERGDYGPGNPELLVARRLSQIFQRSLVTYEIERANGRVLEVQAYGKPSVGYVLTYLDVTERRRAEQSVRESERRLREILANSPFGVSINRADGSRLFWNPRLAEMHGARFGQELGMVQTSASFADPMDFEAIRDEMTAGTPVVGRECLRRRFDGSLWWCLQDVFPFDYWGEPAYIIWHQDVTERREAERELRQNRRFLRAIIDAIPAAISVRDRERRYVLINRTEADLWGVTPAEVIGRAESELGPVAGGPWIEGEARVLATGESVPFREIRLDDGSSHGRTWFATNVPLFDEDGVVAHVLNAALEVTETKRAADALRQSEQRLKLALSVTHAGVWDLDLITDVRWWSPELTAMLGYAEGELPASRDGVNHYIHPEDLARVLAAAKRHLSGETEEFRCQYRLLHRDRTWTWFEDIGRVIRDDDGRAARFIGTVVDITERRATEGELLRSEKMAALGRLVAGVAHEINTPVGLGVGLASHLDERTRRIDALYRSGEIAAEDFEGYLEVALEASAAMLVNLRRAADLVRSFKQVAVDQSSEQRRRFNLKTYIDEVLVSLGPKLKRTQHRIEVKCPEDLSLDSFPGAVSQLLANLIENSLIHGFHTIDSGTITISASAERQHVHLVYTDDGCGMTPEQVDRVFEPFYTTKRGHGGSGLGMHIVYNLVTQTLGGTISVASTPGNGVRVTVRVPRSREGGR